jgi:hypothetical protein
MADGNQLFQQAYPAGSKIIWSAFSLVPFARIENGLPRAAGISNR